MNIFFILISFPLLLLAITVHEFAHGWTAYKLGDTTAKDLGRLTLNPLAHIDLFGTILLPVMLFIATRGAFVFGAAKPVPVNFANLRNPRRDTIWVGLSGPLANFIFAFLCGLAIRFIGLNQQFGLIFLLLIQINVVLAVFNLIPIPPLDGSRVVMGILPEPAARIYRAIEPWGFFIIILLIYLGLFDMIRPIIRAILAILMNGF